LIEFASEKGDCLNLAEKYINHYSKIQTNYIDKLNQEISGLTDKKMELDLKIIELEEQLGEQSGDEL
jgi:hypothetical protein